MRSHLTAIGVGVGVAVVAGGVLFLIAPKHIHIENVDDGAHIVNVSGSNRNSFRIKDGNTDIKAAWRGDLTFSADGRSLLMLGKSLEITQNVRGAERIAEFVVDGESIRTKYSVDGSEVIDAETAAGGAADLLLVFARASGVGASARVRALLSEGGVMSVIAEIDALTTDQSAADYIEALVKATILDTPQVARLSVRVGKFTSDYSVRRVITNLLETQSLTTDVLNNLLSRLSDVREDHERRKILQMVAEHGRSADVFPVIVRELSKIDDDHEFRLVVEAMFNDQSLSDVQLVELVEVAEGHFNDDYELVRLTHAAISSAAHERFPNLVALSMAEQIDDAYERRRALETIANRMTSNDDWNALIVAGSAIAEDLEKQHFLAVIADKMPRTEETAISFQLVLDSFDSDEARNQAAKLVRGD